MGIQVFLTVLVLDSVLFPTVGKRTMQKAAINFALCTNLSMLEETNRLLEHSLNNCPLGLLL